MPIARADRGACDVDPSPSISTVISTSDCKGTPATRLGGLRSSEIWCGIAKFSKHEENGDDGQSRPAPPILSRTWPTCGERDRRNRNEKVFRPIVRDRKGAADFIDARTSTASISAPSAGHGARPQLSLVSSTRVTPGAFGMRCAMAKGVRRRCARRRPAYRHAAEKREQHGIGAPGPVNFPDSTFMCDKPGGATSRSNGNLVSTNAHDV
jgi:hypothetical protein